MSRDLETILHQAELGALSHDVAEELAQVVK